MLALSLLALYMGLGQHSGSEGALLTSVYSEELTQDKNGFC